MASSFQPEYSYARVLGAVSRCRLGSKASVLAKQGRVAEVWKVLFAETAPPLPERLLVSAAERRLETEAVGEFISLAGQVSKHEGFFKALLRKGEFGYVKRLIIALGEGSEQAPEHAAFVVRPSVDESQYPDGARMFTHRRFSWLAESGSREGAFSRENSSREATAAKCRLDQQYYAELWKETRRLPSGLKGSMQRVIKKEVELENVIWALRLRRYYGMRPDEILPLLVALRGADATHHALDALERVPDNKSSWSGWAYEDLINENARSGEDWRLDVRHVEVEARRRIFSVLVQAMHMNLGGYVPLYSYFRIKEYETAALFGVLEGIHLEAPSEEIAAFAAQFTGAYA
jgi:hypothetical protein